MHNWTIFIFNSGLMKEQQNFLKLNCKYNGNDLQLECYLHSNLYHIFIVFSYYSIEMRFELKVLKFPTLIELFFTYWTFSNAWGSNSNNLDTFHNHKSLAPLQKSTKCSILDSELISWIFMITIQWRRITMTQIFWYSNR